MSGLQRTCTFKVKENDYSLQFPSMDLFLKIEATRMALTNGTYGQMLGSGLVTSSVAMDMADMVATLTHLCPELIKDLKVDSLLKLDIVDSVELLEAYQSQVEPWMNGWVEIVSRIKKKPQTSKPTPESDQDKTEAKDE